MFAACRPALLLCIVDLLSIVYSYYSVSFWNFGTVSPLHSSGPIDTARQPRLSMHCPKVQTQIGMLVSAWQNRGIYNQELWRCDKNQCSAVSFHIFRLCCQCFLPPVQHKLPAKTASTQGSPVQEIRQGVDGSGISSPVLAKQSTSKHTLRSSL